MGRFTGDARIRYNYYAGGAQPAQWASVRHGRADLRPSASLRNGAGSSRWWGWGRELVIP
eukprot:scaffold89389_cov69-Phaeocystis_antarctica.AAC.1